MSVAERPQVTVLLVDDETLVRTGLAMLLEAEPDIRVIGEARDGREAIRFATARRPDVVVMDVRMPGLDGVQATRELVGDLAASGSDFAPSVLVLTTFNDDAAVHEALRAGASGFLLKSAAPHALGEAIRAVAAGDAWLDPAVARRLIADFAARPDLHLPAPGELRRLTIRETEVLILAAHGLSNAAIADHLVLSEGTVKTHIARVLRKLGLHDRAHAVVTAYKTGLVRPDDPPPVRRRSTSSR